MTTEQLARTTRRLLGAAHNAKQALDGATKRRKALVGKLKGLKDQVRQQEENLRRLEEEIPRLKYELAAAEFAANQAVSRKHSAHSGGINDHSRTKPMERLETEA
jgi:predicted  nucleic acid-binding Zn-ribbon protein